MLTRWTRARWVMETGKVPWHPHAPPHSFSALHMLCSTYCIRLQINMSVYASFIQTPSTVAADLKKRLGTSQTWSGDREEYRIWYVHALSSLFPCSRFCFSSLFPSSWRWGYRERTLRIGFCQREGNIWADFLHVLGEWSCCHAGY